MNRILRDAFAADIKRAIDTAKAVQAVEHLGVRGRIREILAGELIRPLFPATVEIITGVVADHAGSAAANQSGQEDILVYSTDAMPGGLRVAETGLLPVEACLAVIEVKSVMTAAEVRQSIEHARRISSLRSAYELASEAWPLPSSESRATFPIYNVFALSTDLRSGSGPEWERFEQAHSSASQTTSQIFGACVVGSGAAFWYGDAPSLKPRQTQSPTSDFAEVMAFVSFVADYSRKLRQKKLMDLPMVAYAHYLLP